jgi:hypothetical protein
MSQDIAIQITDAFLNMRGRFWEESRDRALAKKRQTKAFRRQLKKKWELKPDKERKECNVMPAPARAVSAG